MMKLIIVFLLATSFLFSSAHSKESLYFGITNNHRPHVYLNNEEKPSGTLIDIVKTLCEKIDAECNFPTNNFFTHLEELQSGLISGLLVTDSVLLPTTDDIVFTPPLCKISPVFIYKVKNGKPAFQSIDEIKNVTIGVHIDSSFHLYLLDEYYSHSRIKPYSLIESGVFDLANNHIDALLVEKSFFDARVATTALFSKNKHSYLDTLVGENIKLPFNTMSLALSVRNTELYKTLTEAINSLGATKKCVDLVHKSLNKGNPADSHVSGSRK